MSTSKTHINSVDHNGFAVVRNLIVRSTVGAIIARLNDIAPDDRSRNRGGQRNLLALDSVRALACSPLVMALVEAVLGLGARPVRGLLFDKTHEANWLVPWHQDLTICVRERRDVPGYGPWSKKAGVDHVQPPVAVLERMLAVRIHLDDCDESNGALRVLPGTHSRGRMRAAEIAEAAAAIEAQCCAIPRGGALLMKPLLLHSSSPAINPSRRRVLHIEYANCGLEGGLEWVQE